MGAGDVTAAVGVAGIGVGDKGVGEKGTADEGTADEGTADKGVGDKGVGDKVCEGGGGVGDRAMEAWREGVGDGASDLSSSVDSPSTLKVALDSDFPAELTAST